MSVFILLNTRVYFCFNLKTGVITYKRRELPINIRKAKDNYDNNRKPKCFNFNVYKHITKDCMKLKKKKETRKYYKYNKIEHLAENYRSG